jgi:hypothetical protein
MWRIIGWLLFWTFAAYLIVKAPDTAHRLLLDLWHLLQALFKGALTATRALAR